MNTRGLTAVFPKNDKDVFGAKIVRRAVQAATRLKATKAKLEWAGKNKTISSPVRASARLSYWRDKVARLDKALQHAEETADTPRLLFPHFNMAPRHPEGKYFPFEEGTKHYRLTYSHKG